MILAAGLGTRLYPLTRGYPKQLLPIYDKPMIYYPLHTLMMAGITEIMIVTASEHLSKFQMLLGDGSQIGIELSFAGQANSDGLASAILLGEKFASGDPIFVVLGDNLIIGDSTLKVPSDVFGASIFAYKVSNPSDFGVISFNENNEPLSIVEKPVEPASEYCIPGLYIFDDRVWEMARGVRKSERGEYEIVDILQEYLALNMLNVSKLNNGMEWFDAGTPQSLFAAADSVRNFETLRQRKFACIEETAYRLGYIEKNQFYELARTLNKSDYGKYLFKYYMETN